jgi:hypothetical protein
MLFIINTKKTPLKYNLDLMRLDIQKQKLEKLLNITVNGIQYENKKKVLNYLHRLF